MHNAHIATVSQLSQHIHLCHLEPMYTRITLASLRSCYGYQALFPSTFAAQSTDFR
jgi:hypothetical protein